MVIFFITKNISSLNRNLKEIKTNLKKKLIHLKMDLQSVIPKNSIPVALQTLLADLDFLSQIERNTKPCYKNRVLVNANSWFGAIYRMFKGENRNNVMLKVEQIITHAVEAIGNKIYNEHLGLIINSLDKARNGLENLKFTYESDPDMKARINVQIENIDIQLNQYRHLIKGYSNLNIKEDYLPENNDENSQHQVIQSVQEVHSVQEENKSEEKIDLLNSSSSCSPDNTVKRMVNPLKNIKKKQKIDMPETF